MPQYYNSGLGTLALNPVLPAVLWPGDELYLFGTSFASGSPPTPGQIQKANDSNVNYETVTVGERSIAVALAPRPGGGAAPGLMVQVSANGNPGAAEVDVQDTALDADGAYLTPNANYKITSWTAIAGGIYTAWVELQPESGRFVTLKVIANPNSVGLTAKVVYV